MPDALYIKILAGKADRGQKTPVLRGPLLKTYPGHELPKDPDLRIAYDHLDGSKPVLSFFTRHNELVYIELTPEDAIDIISALAEQR